MFKKCFFIVFICLESISYGMWTNWAGNQLCSPIQIYYPQTIDDLSNCVKNSVLRGYKIRVVGAGYSRSNLVCTNGVLIDLKHLNNILSVDSEKKRVRVQAGIVICELNKQLEAHGLALPNQEATGNVTLAGALCTATHGTGHSGTFSSFVTEIELMTADGVMHTISSSDQHILDAALVSFGALGIIYAVTLQCEQLFYLKSNHGLMDIDYLLEHYIQLNEDNDFFQFLWNIESNKAFVYRWNRFIPESKSSPVAHGQKCYQALTHFVVDDNNKDLTAEIAVSIELLPDVLRQVRQLIEKYQQREIKVSSEIMVRFACPDRDECLSPAAGRQVAYINIFTPVEDKYSEFYKEFENLLIAFDGRPHWKKINFLNYEKAFLLYGVRLTNFIKVKHYMDPQGVFANAYIDQLCIQV